MPLVTQITTDKTYQRIHIFRILSEGLLFFYCFLDCKDSLSPLCPFFAIPCSIRLGKNCVDMESLSPFDASCSFWLDFLDFVFFNFLSVSFFFYNLQLVKKSRLNCAVTTIKIFKTVSSNTSLIRSSLNSSLTAFVKIENTSEEMESQRYI